MAKKNESLWDKMKATRAKHLNHEKFNDGTVEGLKPEEVEKPPTADPTLGRRNRKRGDRNEDIASRVTGLAKTAGSGCGLIEKGDLGNEHVLLEAKSTDAASIRVSRNWWRKAKQQAREKNKAFHMLQIAFMVRHVKPAVMENLRWIIVPSEKFGRVWWDREVDADNPPCIDERAVTWKWNQEDGRNKPFLLSIDDDAAIAFPESWLTPDALAAMINEEEL